MAKLDRTYIVERKPNRVGKSIFCAHSPLFCCPPVTASERKKESTSEKLISHIQMTSAKFSDF